MLEHRDPHFYLSVVNIQHLYLVDKLTYFFYNLKMMRDLNWWLQWSATALTLIGAVLTSWGGVPDLARVVAFGIGTLFWFIFSLRIGIRSLIVVNAGLLLIYIWGFINTGKDLL